MAKSVDYHEIEVNNRYFKRCELPNKTQFFASSTVCGCGSEGDGPVYWELPNCSTKSEADKLAYELYSAANMDLSYEGGWLDSFAVKRNSKFRKSH